MQWEEPNILNEVFVPKYQIWIRPNVYVSIQLIGNRGQRKVLSNIMEEHSAKYRMWEILQESNLISLTNKVQGKMEGKVYSLKEF